MGGSELVVYQRDLLGNTDLWGKAHLNVNFFGKEKLWAILRQREGITDALFIAHF